jgi:hypothetical protein
LLDELDELDELVVVEVLVVLCGDGPDDDELELRDGGLLR